LWWREVPEGPSRHPHKGNLGFLGNNMSDALAGAVPSIFGIHGLVEWRIFKREEQHMGPTNCQDPV